MLHGAVDGWLVQRFIVGGSPLDKRRDKENVVKEQAQSGSRRLDCHFYDLRMRTEDDLHAREGGEEPLHEVREDREGCS